VRRIVEEYKGSDLKHKLEKTNDYIEAPKKSGYRSVHLIYRYYSDRKSTYNNLQIEMQLRTLRQHAWAAAVEIVGRFTRHALKSSQGPANWLRFFTLMGTALALEERCAPVPNTPTTWKELKRELRKYAKQLDVQNHLNIYGSALQNIQEERVKDAHYYLLELDPVRRTVKVTGYKAHEFEDASDAYASAERSAADYGGDSVLVSAKSINELKSAYPSYFLDLTMFSREVTVALKAQR
jgi:hypothetical protein